MGEVLKPCPFCGGEGEVRHPSSGYAGDEFRFIVSCKNCKCVAWNINDEWKAGFDTSDEAVEAWNTRYERTCHNENINPDTFGCSECHEVVETYNSYGGYNTIDHMNFCPNCGAKVVE